ncbi:MAG TPA: L-glutamate gamma-semialdehyde dehydrogenase [Propionibacteriaceae bacterium]|nr:L-glutamate gamma-semialdehyde dehydrogenase [Propionibacteriaceae bacterium]
MDAITGVPVPVNEPVLTYAPGTRERAELVSQLEVYANQEPVEFHGRFDTTRNGSGDLLEVTMPADHRHVLGRLNQATQADTEQAIAHSLRVAGDWAAMDFDDRAAIFLKAADLLAGPYRARINAATMLGQAKTVQQAEIDSACELVDFLRFNVAFARHIHEEQPFSPAGFWNRTDYRPLEGFVYAITPFNFTAIAGNLPTAPAIMGNVALWKPSVTQQFAADVFAEVLDLAGLPAGVVTMVPGHGHDVSEVALRHPALAGVHFTGSTRVFQQIWAEIGANISRFHGYPRIVGETGGKDFVVAHPSADPEALRVALVRGAFEYSGQKCSAASRAYVPRSWWETYGQSLIDETEALAVGDVRDLATFTSAVIDQRAWTRLRNAIEAAKASRDAEVVAGGTYDDSEGWYIRPTIVRSDNPKQDVFCTEYFGPLLSVYVYDDRTPGAWADVLEIVDTASPYALTGAVLSTDRAAVVQADKALRQAAGNFYINDKPTGAVVGQQPFGGARASGTNDKAGSVWNLMRWTSPRSIKETFVPPTSVGYPHMDQEHA